jgi:UDP-glucose 4-epimerase
MQGKLILVTGGAGFVGSALVKRLLARGNRVIALDNYFAGSKDAHVEGADYREGHTRDIESLVPETPDLIYHLGEYSRVEQSLQEPDVVWDLNTLGSHAVFEFWRKRKCKLVYAGSSTKFADGGLARDATPYAWTKAANTELVRNYGEWYGLPYAVTYFYNVFGPGERAGAYGTVIEIFKQQYLRGTPITVTSPGNQERNFTHVDDIVDGLVLVGEKGEGDEFGLGNEKVFSMLDVARLYGQEIVMLPPRPGNRQSSSLNTEKSRSLGWEAKRRLEDYIQEFLQANPRRAKLENRVLVFSTTFHPVAGAAEDALCDLMAAMPDVHFDVVTSAFSPDAFSAACPVENATVHRLGVGHWVDKYMLPFWGYWRARELHAKHKYVFAWSLMASYAALAGIFLKRGSGLPLLITLADQDLSRVAPWKKAFLKLALSDADQVYGADSMQERHAAGFTSRRALRRSMGEGDAFANQIRFAYSEFLRKRLAK